MFAETRSLLTMDGLYRINGNCAEIQKLRFLVDADKDFNLLDKRSVLVASGEIYLMIPQIPR